MMLPAAVGKDPEAVNFMGIFPQRLPSSAARLILQFDIDITPRNHAKSLRHHVIFAADKL
jgi:hypothetical protein